MKRTISYFMLFLLAISASSFTRYEADDEIEIRITGKFTKKGILGEVFRYNRFTNKSESLGYILPEEPSLKIQSCGPAEKIQFKSANALYPDDEWFCEDVVAANGALQLIPTGVASTADLFEKFNAEQSMEGSTLALGELIAQYSELGLTVDVTYQVDYLEQIAALTGKPDRTAYVMENDSTAMPSRYLERYFRRMNLEGTVEDNAILQNPSLWGNLPEEKLRDSAILQFEMLREQ